MQSARILVPLYACVSLAFSSVSYTTPNVAHVWIDVELPPTVAADAAGRLLVLAQPVKTGDSPSPDDIELSDLYPAAVAVAGQDVRTFDSSHHVLMDADQDAFPTPFSQLTPGTYRVQVVLDRNGDFGRYYGRGPGDLVTKVVNVQVPLSSTLTIALDHEVPAVTSDNASSASPEGQSLRDAARPLLTDVEVSSKVLTAFWGRPVSLKAWVLVPPGYAVGSLKTWPVAFMLGTFSATHERDSDLAHLFAQLNQSGATPPLIWVFLDYATATGTTEFADSVNNGPWGTALTTELIPALEHRFRMDARPTGRLLTGHSSGGWASLWLQVNYPKIFGGAWATAPDPTDYRRFIGVDLTAPNVNMYFDVHGEQRPQIRESGHVTGTLRDFVRREEVLGHVGGVYQSFDWVFSPRGDDGRPLPMFDRVSGKVNPGVAAYWQRNFDLGRMVSSLPSAAKKALNGKLTVIVGDEDTFYLDGSVHLLKSDLDTAGVKADIRFLPGKNHNNLWSQGDDELGLVKEIARAMYSIARPN